MSEALLRDQDLSMWHAARPFLDVRNNDEHTLVAYGLAKTLLCSQPNTQTETSTQTGLNLGLNLTLDLNLDLGLDLGLNLNYFSNA